jgi:8-amino-7-oxononanoate synthase
MSVASNLREHGFFVPAIRYPTVARKAARLRVTLTASHSKEDVVALGNALKPLSLQLSGLRDA